MAERNLWKRDLVSMKASIVFQDKLVGEQVVIEAPNICGFSSDNDIGSGWKNWHQIETLSRYSMGRDNGEYIEILIHVSYKLVVCISLDGRTMLWIAV